MEATGVDIIPDDLAHVVDARGKGAPSGQRIVECGESAVVRVVEEAVLDSIKDVFAIESDDLARIVDAEGLRSGAQGIVDGRVKTVGKEETVPYVCVSDDLAHVVDAQGKGDPSGQINGRIKTAAVEVAADAAAVPVAPHDLARGVDAIRNGALGVQGIVEGGV